MLTTAKFFFLVIYFNLNNIYYYNVCKMINDLIKERVHTQQRRQRQKNQHKIRQIDQRNFWSKNNLLNSNGIKIIRFRVLVSCTRLSPFHLL
jgi:hypothetical protein